MFRSVNLPLARLTDEEISAGKSSELRVENGQPALYLTPDFRIEYVHNVTATQTDPQTGQEEVVIVRQEPSFWTPFAGALAGQAIGSLLFRPQYYMPPLYQPGVARSAMAVMDEATTKPFRAISHATKHPLLNIGIVSIGQVAGYARPVALPLGLTLIGPQAMASATVICDVTTDGMSVLGLQVVVLVVHNAARPHAVALPDPADGGSILVMYTKAIRVHPCNEDGKLK